ncbi:MAG: DUF3786 domain-containing protein [Deltaproteobacteria bacterium]|nr:DUF3786 domain-containing protein [Deltaproteobacteria bacterium]RLB82318.1 MAG: hypothetical protein DRH17_06330 [Deltaproteobacteria bacterium]
MPTQDDYKTARALALDTLSKVDIERCCINAGLLPELISPGIKRVPIPYLGDTYSLTVCNEQICFDDASGPLKIPDQVLLLHYLITAQGVPVGDEWITFREVPSGPFYYAAFIKRAITPLVKCFGGSPSLLEEVAHTIGQVLPSPGDKALKVLALPRVPVVLSLWKGDEEFPPEANLYFDQSIVSYLPTEDIAYLAGAVVYKVIGIARNMALCGPNL